MDPVPVYSINSGCGSSFNGWEAMALMNNRNNGYGYSDCFGGGMWAWILLLLFGWGGGYGGFGGRGGFGGGFGCNGGIGALGADLAITDATNIAELKAGANYNAQAVNGIRNAIGDVKDVLCSQFANITNQITSSAYQNQLGQRDLQATINTCCCNTQQNIAAVNNNITQQFAQLNYNNAMQNCEIKKAIAEEGAATRALLNAQYTQELERKLTETKQQLFVYEKFGRYAGEGNC